jgi:ATP-binding cassette, subfamily G (WHITE), member 2, PDR
MMAFWVFFTATFLIATEYQKPPPSRGEVLVFQRGHIPDELVHKSHAAAPADEESGKQELGSAVTGHDVGHRMSAVTSREIAKELHTSKDIFTWKNVCCDVIIKDEKRRLLSNVTGYVKPGTLTALMGVSGAGKTTLLDTYLP